MEANKRQKDGLALDDETISEVSGGKNMLGKPFIDYSGSDYVIYNENCEVVGRAKSKKEAEITLKNLNKGNNGRKSGGMFRR